MAVAALLALAVSCKPQEKHAKYVFYFIGDGMGSTHVAAAEAYLAQERGVIGMDPLCFTQFPVMGEAVSCQPHHHRLVGGRHGPFHGREDEQRHAMHRPRFHHPAEKHRL